MTHTILLDREWLDIVELFSDIDALNDEKEHWTLY